MSETGTIPETNPRKDFLRKALTFSFSASAGAVLTVDARLAKPLPKETFLAKITLAGGKKAEVGLIMGVHGQNKATITEFKESDFYKPVGAFFLDAPCNYLDPQNQKLLPKVITTIASPENDDLYFLRPAFNLAFTNKIPLLLGDISTNDLESLSSFSQSGQRYLTPVTMALSNLGLVLENNTSNLSRRQFFKGVSLTGAVAALHFSNDGLIRLIRRFGFLPDSDLARDLQTVIHDLTQPENRTLVMRNIVWALKCRNFLEEGFISEGKTINIVGGSGHAFVDFFLRYPDFAKKYWHALDYGKCAANFADGDPSWVYKTYVFNPDTKQGALFEHKNLIGLAQ